VDRDRPADTPVLCRLGLHRWMDFPDPNPETRGLEQQGYRACARCPKEVDRPTYLPRHGLLRGWFPARDDPGHDR
jgi:hypothetical protein